jgi:HAD superfamily hydrolase (TIGR01509 family)
MRRFALQSTGEPVVLRPPCTISLRDGRKRCVVEALRAVLFDLDGVLIDSYEAWFRVANGAARYFRKPDIDRERFQQSWGQSTEADLKEFFPGCTLEEVEAFYENRLLDFVNDVKVDPEAHATLVALRNAEILRGVVTNTPIFLARDLLAAVGLIGLIDVTVGAERGLQPKPSPDIVLRACDLLQVQPQEALLVGDSAFDEKAAQAAKVPFVGFRRAAPRSVQKLGEVVKLVESRS